MREQLLTAVNDVILGKYSLAHSQQAINGVTNKTFLCQ